MIALSFAYVRADAQNTVITGVVTDDADKQPIPNASIAVVGSSQGTSSSVDGRFRLVLSGSYTQVRVSSVGYGEQLKNFLPGREQALNFVLRASSQQLQVVTVHSGKKKKYTNKNNPAVELIRKVIAHKPENRPESYPYQQYTSYEKMIFSLSNLSEKFMHKKIFKNYQFLFREQDSTAIGGKNLLPLYMEEKLSDNFISKQPERKKQVVRATKQVKYDENFVDNQGLQSYFNRMYQDIDIYENNVSLLSNQLLSPISDNAPGAYKFFITDTIRDQTPQLIELSFTPRNTTDMLFEGRIYITLDGHYAVEHAVLSANKNINLNFVRRMETILKFDRSADGKYYLSNSDLKIDFGINKRKGGGIFGERNVVINDFRIAPPKPISFFDGKDVVVEQGADEKSDEFWVKNRLDTLKQAEADIYKNIDSLQTIPSFKRTMDIATLLLAGYKKFNWFEVGPVNTFYSFNPVEGFRLRLGGRTTTDLSKRYYFETYAAYGFKDERMKYFLSATYSINDKSIYKFPQHYVRASFQHDTKIPGQELQFVQEDNFLLSFKRGENNLWLYNDIFRLDYVQEYENHLSFRLGFKKWDQNPAGELHFIDGANNPVNDVRTSEVSAELRYAPNEKFYQGKLYRTPIIDKYPIITLRYNQGIKDLFGGDHNYQNITLNLNKRFYLGRLGYTDVVTEGSQLFGTAPFPLLDIHRANQSYAFQFQSYNLMNFLEFVSDHYAAISVDHHFNGLIFNRVPLLKELKWREVINVKGLWGGVRAENDPSNNIGLLQFPRTSTGAPVTYALDHDPYVEGSIGVANIFKLLRVDYVRRFTYLDHPGIAKSGIRFYVKFDF